MSEDHLALRFSLMSLLVLTGLLAAYISLHTWVEREWPVERDGSLRSAVDAHYGYRVPKDLVCMVGCCLLLQRSVMQQPGALLGGLACLINLILSCAWFFMGRLSSGWVLRGNPRIIWNSLGNLTWILMVVALWLAVRAGTQRSSASDSTRH